MKKNLLFTVFLFSISLGFSQNKGIWKQTNDEQLASLEKARRNSFPDNYKLYELDFNAFKSLLIGAPVRGVDNSKSKVVIDLPNSEGIFQKFRVIETPIMEKELAEKFPMIKSYAAQGIDDPTAVARFSVTQFGLHNMTLSGGKSTEFLDPYTTGLNYYIAYNKTSLGADSSSFECLTDEGAHLPSLENDRKSSSSENRDTDDKKLRTYRLAQSCTAEYGNLFRGNTSDPIATQKARIQAQMAITMTRVNGIYENDLGITMVFIANNDLIIYLGATNSDPWNGEYNTQTGITIDSVIGFANYDIGHNFNTSGGGNAGCIGCVCGPNTTPSSGLHKGTGMTGHPNPTGDPFDIDYVAHEMGHQFGGYHTQSSSGCRSGSGATEVEPGSASTIMGYAGICAANVQSNSDAYFAYVNIRDILLNVKSGVSSTCAQITNITNNPPVVDAGADYIIPRSTAFMLIANGSDPDGDVLTYTWEQNDPENPNTTAAPTATRAVGPMFRSTTGTTSPTRYMPNLTTVLAGGTSNTWEVCPSVARDLNFSVTARDNKAGGGQTSSDLMKVTVDGASGPFVVTVPNTAVSWQAGTNQNVTWNVANSNLAPVNAKFVDIYLSTNGGSSFPILLASKVPNDGSEVILVPNITGTQNRIMVRGYNNIFYDLSNTNFTITAPASTFGIAFNGVAEEQNKSACKGAIATYTFPYTTYGGYSSSASFTVTGQPTGSTVTFTPSSTSTAGTITMEVTNTTGSPAAFYTMAVTATSGSTKTLNFYLDLLDSGFGTQLLTSPSDGAISQSTSLSLTWPTNAAAASYDVQVATDSGFTAIVFSGNVVSNSYSLSGLSDATTYYWRVKPKNAGCEGVYSSAYNFQTGQTNCLPTASVDVPKTIRANNANTVNSTLTIPTGVVISDLDVNINISHTYIQDLTITLIGPAPSNTQIVLLQEPCGDDDDMNVTMDDSGSMVICSGVPALTGVRIPFQALSAFNGQNSAGTWTLRVADGYNGDGGFLNSWSLNICEVQPLAAESFNSINDLAIYPNPNNGNFTVQFNSTSNNEVKIGVHDVRGRQIFDKSYQNNGLFNQSLNLNNVQSGVYFVTVQDGSRKTMKKIIVE